MPSHTERVETHPVNDKLESLDDLLAKIDAPEQDVETGMEALERVRQVHAHLKKKLLSGDPNLVATQTLDNLNVYLQNQINELTTYRDSDSTTPHLEAASTQCDHILVQISDLPLLEEPSDVESIRTAVTSFRKAVGQYIHNLEEEYQSADTKFQQLSAQLSDLLSDIEGQKQRLDTAISAFQQQFSESEDRRREDFTQAEKTRSEEVTRKCQALTEQVETLVSDQEAAFERKSAQLKGQEEKVDAAIAKIRSQFAEEAEKRTSEFSESQKEMKTAFQETQTKHQEQTEKLLEDHRTSSKGFFLRAEEERRQEEAKFVSSSEEFMARLSEYKGQAEALVHVIGNTGMVGGYQRVANEERDTARRWHWIAGGSMIGLVGFAIYAFVLTLHSGFTWGLFAGRAFVAVTFGILSTYAAREAEKHNEIERRNRRMELELASINPYLAELPTALQQEIKQNLAERLFGQKDIEETKPSATSAGTALDIVKVALENLKLALEQIKK